MNAAPREVCFAACKQSLIYGCACLSMHVVVGDPRVISMMGVCLADFFLGCGPGHPCNTATLVKHTPPALALTPAQLLLSMPVQGCTCLHGHVHI